MPYSYNYGHTTDQYDEVMKFDHPLMINLMRKYRVGEYNNVRSGGYFSAIDSIVLHAMLRESKPSTMIEVGAGLTTDIAFSALKLNGNPVTYYNFTVDVKGRPAPPPPNVEYILRLGDLLDEFPKEEIPLEEVDLVFIDGCHEAYFAIYYFYDILMKLSKGTLVHIHDCSHPDVLTEANQKGWAPVGESWPVATPSGEAYAVYQLLKNHPGEFEVLCEVSMLLKDNAEELAFVREPKGYARGAAAQSLWLKKA